MSYFYFVVCKTSLEIKGEYCSNKEDCTCSYHIKLFPDSKISGSRNSAETVARLENTKKGCSCCPQAPCVCVTHCAAPCCQPLFCALEVMKGSWYFSNHDHQIQSRGRTKMGSHWRANAGLLQWLWWLFYIEELIETSWLGAGRGLWRNCSESLRRPSDWMCM